MSATTPSTTSTHSHRELINDLISFAPISVDEELDLSLERDSQTDQNIIHDRNAASTIDLPEVISSKVFQIREY
jgi:hypothetical protein